MARTRARRERTELAGVISAILFALLVVGTTIAAEWTHIIVCIKAGEWGLLIAGAILPPIGVIHGIGVWLGAF